MVVLVGGSSSDLVADEERELAAMERQQATLSGQEFTEHSYLIPQHSL